MRQALENNKIVVGDSGEVNRTYCYVSDTTEMLCRLMIGGAGIFNIGGRSQTTIKDLALHIGEIVGCVVEFSPEKFASEGAPAVNEVSIAKYIGRFGDKKFTNLHDGLVKTIGWWRSNH